MNMPSTWTLLAMCVYGHALHMDITGDVRLREGLPHFQCNTGIKIFGVKAYCTEYMTV